MSQKVGLSHLLWFASDKNFGFLGASPKVHINSQGFRKPVLQNGKIVLMPAVVPDFARFSEHRKSNPSVMYVESAGEKPHADLWWLEEDYLELFKGETPTDHIWVRVIDRRNRIVWGDRDRFSNIEGLRVKFPLIEGVPDRITAEGLKIQWWNNLNNPTDFKADPRLNLGKKE